MIDHPVSFSLVYLIIVKTFQICETAYLANVTLNDMNYALHWIDNGTENQTLVPIRNPFYVETGTTKNYYVQFKNIYECYIIEYGEDYNPKEYLYYCKHFKDQLVECGGVKDNEFVPFKLFYDNDMMREYIYRFDNQYGKNEIDVNSKKEVYHGKYINNPKNHYPRMIQQQSFIDGTSGNEVIEQNNGNNNEWKDDIEQTPVSNSNENDPATKRETGKLKNEFEEKNE